jgi:hypothetical protein
VLAGCLLGRKPHHYLRKKAHRINSLQKMKNLEDRTGVISIIVSAERSATKRAGGTGSRLRITRLNLSPGGRLRLSEQVAF